MFYLSSTSRFNLQQRVTEASTIPPLLTNNQSQQWFTDSFSLQIFHLAGAHYFTVISLVDPNEVNLLIDFSEVRIGTLYKLTMVNNSYTPGYQTRKTYGQTFT